METYKTSFDKGTKRKFSKEYISIQNKEQRLRRSISTLDRESEERKQKQKEHRALRNRRVKMTCSQPMDTTFKRIFYQRYADDFLVGIIDNRQDALACKQDIQSFLYDRLRLELSKEKTLITHGHQKAQFLGYEITMGRKGTPSKDCLGKLSDWHYGRVHLYLPKNAWRKNWCRLER